jgi:small subunit ribosomal protein S9
MFAEEREPDTPEEEGVPGEPGEAAPSEEEAASEAGAPGPEIEGAEALSAAAEGEQPAAEEPAPSEESAPAEEEEAAPAAEGDEPAAEGEAEDAAPRERKPRKERSRDKSEEEVIPGMHLEPDLVLEEQREESEFGQYADAEAAYGDDEAGDEAGEEAPAEPEPVAHTPLDLAADARYGATGKRKSAVARVILKPGEGTFSVNGRHLDEYFPRVKLQRVARQPLEAAGYNTRLDVVARIHGGGVSAQATALRHGIARALVEADPALRSELKRRGYLTRDPRVKERKKAGLKKARKRPQFSKR